jgi:hypothetical protein
VDNLPKTLLELGFYSANKIKDNMPENVEIVNIKLR